MDLNLNKYFDSTIEDGIYQINMDVDDFITTLEIADIENAVNYFRKSSNFEIIRGISYKSGFIPKNPVAYKKVPIEVHDANFDDFEEIDVLRRKDLYYYLRSVDTNNAYPLMEAKEVREKMEREENINIDFDAKEMTPEIKLALVLSKMDVVSNIKFKEEAKKKESPEEYIKDVLRSCGAEIISSSVKNYGIEVVWSYENNQINSLFSNELSVLEAGFCVSGYDKTQSAHSVVNLMKEYVDNGDYIYKTRY